MEQADKAQRFRQLHAGEEPLRLANAWDRTSARVFEQAGAKAIGTTSAGLGLALGYGDGQRAPWMEVLAVVGGIVDAVDVPVSVDVEAGWGDEPDGVARTVRDVVAAGAVGINLEDSVPDGHGALFPVDAQAARIAAAKSACNQADDVFVNARCDVFFGGQVDGDPLDEALRRGEAYAAAGADGFFVPGLLDVDLLSELAKALDMPVNAMVGPGSPTVEELAEAGVRRLSQGAWPFAAVVGCLDRLARDFVEHGGYGRPGELDPAWDLLGALATRTAVSDES
ncbi:MAG: isocitrate lyase/phosphoenolpyruvate mutase family protein [Actinomycetota bacterium]|nr:isocitrate lyase/phosphoenolpyruvate mutase family protein [Actinomycetota bacterium]